MWILGNPHHPITDVRDGRYMFELLVIDGPEKGLKSDLKTEIAYVGRSKDCDIRIKDFTVSRRHLRCTFQADEFMVEDLGSVNGTLVEGRPMEAGKPISASPGCVIRLGKTTITLRRLTKHTLDPALKEKAYSGSNSRARDERHVELLNDVARMISDKALGFQATAEAVLELTLRFISRADRAALFVHLPNKGTVRKIASFSTLPDGGSVEYSRRTVTRTIRESAPVILFDTDNEKILDAGDKQIRSLLCLPLYRKTKAIGALYLDSLGGRHAFRKSDVAMLDYLCALVSAYLQRELSDAFAVRQQ
jgi:hypothetical protein